MTCEQSTISLTIDYGNGYCKKITGLRPRPLAEKAGVDVFDVLDAASSRPPGLNYEFTIGGTDRVGNEIGVLSSIDGVSLAGMKWRCRTDAHDGFELRRFTPTNTFTRIGRPDVKPGDNVTIALVNE